MPRLAPERRVALEVELLELDAELALIRSDFAEGRTPPKVRRAMFDHERAAGVNFARLESTVDARAGRIGQRLAEDRTRFADLLRQDLAAAIEANPHLDPAHVATARLGDLLDPSVAAAPVAGSAELVHAAEQFYADELAASVHEGISRAASEAKAQGVAALRPSTIPADLQARLDLTARRLAAAPHADVVAAARDSAHQAIGVGLPAGALLDAVHEDATSLSAARLDSRFARPAAQQAHNIGHQEGAATVPAVARIYASELLDRNTCGPCSLIDGNEYDSEEEALADYPAGTYVDCEGGDNCRGTLVYVYGDEQPSTDSLPDPGDEPPPPPVDPYPLGSSRPFDPGPAPATHEQTGPRPEPPPAGSPAGDSPPAPAPIAPEQTPTAPPVEDSVDVELDTGPFELPASPVEAGYTADELDAARRAIPAARAEVRAAAEAARDEALGTFEIADFTKFDRPPPRVRKLNRARGIVETTGDAGGEWDWFYGLSDKEQVRIRRNWMFDDLEGHGSAPDEVAERWHQYFGTTSTDDAMNEWLDVNRRIDANGGLARGRLPNPDLYGGLDPNSLVDSPYDLRVLFSNDEELVARHLAGVNADLEQSYAERAFTPARLGPAPYAMTEADFTAELERLDEVVRNLAPLDEWDTYAPADQAAMDRLAELVPYGLDDPASPKPADELYQAILKLAKRAGLT